MLELVVVDADQRVGGRDRGPGHAGHQAAERQQGMFQAVLAQDGDRPFRVQATVDQPLGNAAGGGPGLGISDVAPIAQAAVGVFHAAGHEGLLWLDLCPVPQPVCQSLGESFQVLLSTQVVGSGHAIAQRHAGDTELEGAEFRGAHCLVSSHLQEAALAAEKSSGLGLAAGEASCRRCQLVFWTLAALPSRKARTRALASGADWAIEDIRASVRKPWSAGCSAMRGRACMRA